MQGPSARLTAVATCKILPDADSGEELFLQPVRRVQPESDEIESYRMDLVLYDPENEETPEIPFGAFTLRNGIMALVCFHDESELGIMNAVGCSVTLLSDAFLRLIATARLELTLKSGKADDFDSFNTRYN